MRIRVRKLREELQNVIYCDEFLILFDYIKAYIYFIRGAVKHDELSNNSFLDYVTGGIVEAQS